MYWNSLSMECKRCHMSCGECSGSAKNCTACWFGYDKIHDARRNEKRCVRNGMIGYSAVIAAGSLLGLVGGIYLFAKKKKTAVETRERVITLSEL